MRSDQGPRLRGGRRLGYTYREMDYFTQALDEIRSLPPMDTKQEFLTSLSDVERRVALDVRLALGDRQIPQEYLDRADEVIAVFSVFGEGGLVMRAVNGYERGDRFDSERRRRSTTQIHEIVLTARTSLVIIKLKDLFREVEAAAIHTRFGTLTNNPRECREMRDRYHIGRRGRR